MTDTQRREARKRSDQTESQKPTPPTQPIPLVCAKRGDHPGAPPGGFYYPLHAYWNLSSSISLVSYRRPLLLALLVRSHSSSARRVRAAFCGGACSRLGLPRLCAKRLSGRLAWWVFCNSRTVWSSSSSETSLERSTLYFFFFFAYLRQDRCKTFAARILHRMVPKHPNAVQTEILNQVFQESPLTPVVVIPAQVLESSVPWSVLDLHTVAWCLSCLHGLALRSQGSWLGGSRVSALRIFCLAPVGPSSDFDDFVLLLLQWMASSGRGTQVAWSLRFK